MRALLVATLVLVSFGVASRAPTGTPIAGEQDNQQLATPDHRVADKKKSADPTTVVNQAAASQTPAMELPGPSNPPEKSLWEKLIESAALAVTAIASGVVAAYTVVLARTTKQLWKEARDAGSAAKTSADAASKAAQIAEATLVSSNRPWLVITDVKQRRVDGSGDDVDGGYNLAVTIKNVGHSPATHIFANATVIGDKWPGDAALQTIISDLRGTPSKGVTLVPDDSDIVDAWCLPDDRDPRDHTELGLMVCCVFYSFPLKSGTNEGLCYGIYRAKKESLEARDLRISLDKRSVHAE